MNSTAEIPHSQILSFPTGSLASSQDLSKRIHLPAYDIGAEANPAHFAPVITNEITILKIKELKLNDAAFVLSNKKWTYALLAGKEKDQQDGTFTFKFQLGQDCYVNIQAQSKGEWNLLSQIIRLVKHY